MGVCDYDPTNDCVQDCAGSWGGAAMEDMCGDCDSDPTNDCVQDCAGAWGGAAMEDLCGVCDDDPTNDCECDPGSYVPDGSCMLSGVCAATAQASSCVGGTIIPCAPGTPNSVADGSCNSLDDDCNGEPDEDVSCNRSDLTVTVVAIYDAEAAKILGPDPIAALTTVFAHTANDFTNSAFSTPTTVKLVAVLSWDVTPGITFPVMTPNGIDSTDLLNELTAWFQANRPAISAMAAADADHVILVTGKAQARSLVPGMTCAQQLAAGATECLNEPSSTVALSWSGAMCGAYSAGWVRVKQNEPPGFWGMLVAHGIGHNFSMTHVATGIMTASASPSAYSTTFSTESITQMETWVATYSPACLDDLPLIGPDLARCGDGRKQPGEQCDPGVGTTDPCCTATCQLAPGCECAYTEPCCSSGVLSDSSRVCRPARGICDLADTCDGVTPDCPRDYYYSPGTPCLVTDCAGDTSTGQCLRGACISGQAECRAPSSCLYSTWLQCPTTDCSRVWCSAPPSTCNVSWMIAAPEGLACGAGSQCSAAACVLSSALKEYEWRLGAWSACAGGIQTRVVTCEDEQGTAVSDAFCSMPPADTRSCP